VPVVVTGLGKRRKTLGTKPGRMQRRPFGKERGKVVGMKFTQDFHLAINFANDNAVLKVFVGMKILTVLLDPFHDEERQIAPGAVRAKGGDAKEGRELVRHGQRLMMERKQNN
jgi:hypothetical protein